MSVGLLGLLDDVTALAKVAAASIDDVAGQATKAGLKAAGAVIDDAAVTPNYVTGFTADRELPIVWRIAMGSIRNKLIILLPAAVALSYFAPWIITPILMLGGAYLCYEGAEKVFEALFPHAAHEHEHEADAPDEADPQKLEEDRVAGAIQTDLILSAEIMTIALASLPGLPLWETVLVLVVVAFGITGAVYGAVALIVKADDFGLALARKGRTGAGRALGRGILRSMPWVMQTLSIVGTAAMIWVGGGIILHGLEEYGLGWPSHVLHDAGAAVARAVPFAGAFLAWLVEAAGAGVAGIVVGLIAIPLASRALSPLWRQAKSRIRRIVPRHET